MSQQFIHQLTVYLKGGQTLVIPFNAESADKLNPQIEAFMKALGDKNKFEGNFVFQGQRVVLIHLPDVSGAEVLSLVRTEKTAAKEEAKAPKVETAKAKA